MWGPGRVAIGEDWQQLWPSVKDLSQFVARYKTREDIEELNTTTNQEDPNSIHKPLPPTTAQNTHLSNFHGTYPKIDDIMSRKTHLNKLELKSYRACS